MAVKIGSARSDERGKITGGKAGGQKNERRGKVWQPMQKNDRLL